MSTRRVLFRIHLSLSPSLYLPQQCLYALSRTRTRTRTLFSVSLCLSREHTHTLFPPPSLSHAHAQTRTHTLSFSLFISTECLFLLSLFHDHALPSPHVQYVRKTKETKKKKRKSPASHLARKITSKGSSNPSGKKTKRLRVSELCVGEGRESVCACVCIAFPTASDCGTEKKGQRHT